MPAPAVVQKNANVALTGSPTTSNFASAQTAGNMNLVAFWLVEGAYPGPPTNVPTLTDTSLNTYHLVANNFDTSSSDGTIYLYYAWNIKAAGAGANTVSLAFTGALSFTPTSLFIAEISNIQNTSDPLRVSNTNQNQFATTNAPSVSLAGTVSTDFIALAAIWDSVQNPTSGNLSAIEDQNFTSLDGGLLGGGTVTPNMGSTDGGWWAVAAAFKAAHPDTMFYMVD